MKKYFFGFITGLLFYSQLLFAQQSKLDSSKTPSLRSFGKFSISWDTGLEWEQKISKTSVLIFLGGISVGTATDGFSFSNLPSLSEFGIVPAAYVEYRNYYNKLRRINNNKKTENNSANFLFGRIETYFPVGNRNNFNLLIIQGWGAQRSLSKKISLTCHLGIIEHFYFDKYPGGKFNYIKFEPLTILSISYIL
jgi:hypothetical protein